MKKREIIVRVPLQPGRCRWCGCTDENGCANGCTWWTSDYTLCSECAPFDAAIRTRRGRAALLDVVHDAEAMSLS